MYFVERKKLYVIFKLCLIIHHSLLIVKLSPVITKWYFIALTSSTGGLYHVTHWFYLDLFEN